LVENSPIDDLADLRTKDRSDEEEREAVERIFVRMLTTKLGPVPPSIADDIKNLSTADLIDFCVATLDFNPYADAEKWLAIRQAEADWAGGSAR